jgi:hypothetical protein
MPMGWGVVGKAATTVASVGEAGGEALTSAGEAVWEGASSAGETLSAASAAVASGLVKAAADVGPEVVEFSRRFADDPIGALEHATDDAWGTMTAAVSLGVDQIAERALREAGLGPLVEGIAYTSMWSTRSCRRCCGA